jgi:hypothetical protein
VSASVTPSPLADGEQGPSTEAERLSALVRERYGDRLTPEQLDGVKKGIEGIVQAARALRAVRLENSDEPMPPFVPYRAGP